MKSYLVIIESLIVALNRNKTDLPQVHLLEHHIPQKDLPRLYKAVDAFVLPTRGEGYGPSIARHCLLTLLI